MNLFIILFSLFCFVFVVFLWFFNLPALKQESFQRKVIKKARRPSVVVAKKNVFQGQRLSEIPFINDLLIRVPVLRKLALTISRFELGANVFVILMSCFVIGGGLFVFLTTVGTDYYSAFSISFIFSLVPFFIIKCKLAHRRKRFEMHFVEGLSIVKNALKSGQGLTAAFKIVSEDAPWPVDVEFQKLLSEVEYGFSFQDALEQLERRICLEELSFFVSIIKIQMQTGGNLAEVIENIEQTIRTRFELKREVNTLSAQGKMSGLILVSMPIVLVLVLSVINPGFLNPLLNDPLGVKMLIVAIFGGIIGVFWIFRIVRVKI